MLAYQHEFIQLALEHKVLQFGDFTLKSGRKSPYFFNLGLFYQAEAVKKLGEFYAQAIITAGISFDVIFGPAYKGIPLAVSTAIALNQQGYDYPFAFNRKEIKDHGEGGNIVGASLDKKILVLDDVITAGTAFFESKKCIEEQGGKISGLVVALDRQEKGANGQPILKEIQQTYHIPVLSLITLADLISYLKEHPLDESEHALPAILAYQKQFGIHF